MEPLMSEVRKAAVAGKFYAGSPAELERDVQSMIGPGPVRQALGAMAPHAGYVYSGAVAGEVYGAVAMPDLFVILGPNHTGLGAAAAVMSSGIWRLPMGDALVDNKLARSIISHSSVLTADETAHTFEHSIEVQLPFLQYLMGEVRFVPISLMLTGAEALREIGQAIADAVSEEERRVLIIASSDMTHYESQAVAQEKDTLALTKLLDLDADGLLETVIGNHISMCGVAPATVMLHACRALGATDAKLIRYATSGDVTGDYSQVVGYAGVIVT